MQGMVQALNGSCFSFEALAHATVDLPWELESKTGIR